MGSSVLRQHPQLGSLIGSQHLEVGGVQLIGQIFHPVSLFGKCGDLGVWLRPAEELGVPLARRPGQDRLERGQARCLHRNGVAAESKLAHRLTQQKRASGSGGQHVNTTDSAVRILHIPTGLIVVSAEKSQHRNREIAMQVLKTRLFDLERQRVDGERSADRKAQVGSGDRSERIRTYNFPQGRMTDHRINLTLYALAQVMAGDLDEIIDALTADAQATLLAEMGA